jgi:hypothetical protein
MMDEEQKNAITWIAFGGDKYWQDCGKPELSMDAFSVLTPLTGLQVVIRRGELHDDDCEIIEWFAKTRGCRIVEEEGLQLTGVYQPTYTRT